jgi:hypothetical protein
VANPEPPARSVAVPAMDANGAFKYVVAPVTIEFTLDTGEEKSMRNC